MSRASGRTRRGPLVGLVAAAALVLAGCSSSGSRAPGATAGSTAPPPASTASPTTPTTAPQPPQGFTAVTLVVTAADGTTSRWCVWLADTELLRQRGLMGVTDPELGGLAGMLFRFDQDSTDRFWMRDTPLALSIAWYDASGRFVSSTDMAPCPGDAATCPTYGATGPYRDAIEVPQGQLGASGLVQGSTISVGDRCDAPARAV